MNLRILDKQNWCLEFSKLFLSVIEQAIIKRGCCRIFITGGISANAFYKFLATNPSFLSFDALEIFLSDERCVRPDSINSNFFTIRNNLCSSLLQDKFLLHQMYRADEAPRVSALRCCNEYPDFFDLGLISAADDGHIASIFSGSKAMEEFEHKVITVSSSDHQFTRLTVTPRIFAQTDRIFVLAIGNGKHWVIDEVSRSAGVNPRLPATLLRDKEWIIA